MIEVQSLRRTYADTVALDGVSFHVGRGEIVGLLGPNGAGKTTCLRVLTCFVPPTSGRVTIDGLDVRDESQAVRAKLGYLPEGMPLYPELRVREYLRFRAGLRGLAGRAARRAVEEAIETCGLGEVQRRIVGQLSRGFRQRLSLASTLLGRPSVLVLDEPTVGLDPNQVREARALIATLGGAHTVMLSTHVLADVEAICSRVLVLDRGRLIAEGPVAELRASGRGVLVTVRGPVGRARQVLGELGQVETLAEEEGQLLRCRLLGDSSGERREQIAAVVLAAGLALQELAAERATLEQVFSELTAQERSA